MRKRKVWVGFVVVAVLGLLVWQPLLGAEDVFSVVTDVFHIVQEQYWRGVEAKVLVQGALKGIMEALNDPYAQYMPPRNYDNFVQSATGAYVGIGIGMEPDPNGLFVTRVFRNSPASAAGLKAGDIILFINGKDTRLLTLSEISELVRGEEGTSVSLSFYRGTVDTLQQVEVTRAHVAAPSAEWKALENNIGYIKIEIFGESLKEDIEEAMTDLAATKGLILDMRGCPGGLLDSLMDVAPYFVKEGPLTIEVSQGGQRNVIYSAGPGPEKPMVVLVNDGTASAAEILLGGIIDSKSGVVIGTKTYGKGAAQSVYNLGKELGGYKFTVVGYLTPSGKEIDGVGLKPHILVERSGTQFFPPKSELISASATLRLGMHNDEVKKLQQALKVLGFFSNTPYGYYGPFTETAVKAFQKSIGMEPTGVANFEVIEAINVRLIVPPQVTDNQLDAAAQKVLEMVEETASNH